MNSTYVLKDDKCDIRAEYRDSYFSYDIETATLDKVVGSNLLLGFYSKKMKCTGPNYSFSGTFTFDVLFSLIINSRLFSMNLILVLIKKEVSSTMKVLGLKISS